ncbi:FecR family protein [Formosa haliotis]|uniref:FecR family protein n=1 Tax=Formosa haliotis TaxID=1555194 RepID=UPI00082428AA|nr:FecR domain-containing protein [Formosa haliotis]
MNEIKNQIHYSKLLVGKILGTLTKEQEQELFEWEQKGNNQEVAKDILNPDAFSAWKQKMQKVDTAKEWKHFLERMDEDAKIRTKVRRLRVIKWTSAVAAVLVIGIALFSLFNTGSAFDSYDNLQNSSIAPGASNAQLVLSTGEVVDLKDGQENEIAENKTAVSNAKGVLFYKTNTNEKVVSSKINTLKIPKGGEYQLVLSDGTKVWLNSDTELTYEVPFTGSHREVSLKGEAYFEVASNKAMPFIVVSGEQKIEVLGTKFNVSAYTNQNNIQTTLVEGRVKVLDTLSAKEIILSPNEQSTLRKNTSELNKKIVDVYPYTAWKDGRFVFKNASLEFLLDKMARWYNVDVVFTDESLKQIKFTGDLPRYNDMTNILEIIEAEMSVHIKVENNKTIYVIK